MSGPLLLILGSFNPPTVAHVAMGEVLHRAYPEARITYLPSNERYLKNWKGFDEGQMLPIRTRAALLESAIDRSYAAVSLAEEDPEKTDGRTWNTLQYFRRIGEEDIILAMGGDNLAILDKWYMGRELAENFRVAVLCREGDARRTEALLPGALSDLRRHFHFLPFDYEGISSSGIRKACAEGRLDEVKEQLPENVYSFLAQNGQKYSRYGV